MFYFITEVPETVSKGAFPTSVNFGQSLKMVITTHKLPDDIPIPPIIPVKAKKVYSPVKSGAHKAPSIIVPVSKTGNDSGLSISHLVDNSTAVEKMPPPSAITVVAAGRILQFHKFENLTSIKPSNYWCEGCRSCT